MVDQTIIKKKIVIKGRKVQNVGYRPFLLNVADSELISNFDARNKIGVDKDGNEILEVFVGGLQDQVENFIEFIKDGVKNSDNRPEKADVKSIEVVDKDYKGNIRTTESFSRWLANNQLYKMTAIGTVMLEKQDIMIEKQDIMIEKQDGMIGKMDLMIEKQDGMIEKQDETINEIKNLRYDLKSDDRFNKIEKDVSRIKAKIKMVN